MGIYTDNNITGCKYFNGGCGKTDGDKAKG